MMHVMIVAFTVRGCQTAKRVSDVLEGDSCEIFSKTTADVKDAKKILVPLVDWTGNAMATSDALIFVGATGVAVRMIAPHIKDKKKDPAVICMDDNGKYVISLLSGHVGGANRLTSKIAKGIDGIPVITTATDVNGKFAVDVFAVENSMKFRGKALAKEVSARLLDGKDVYFESEFRVDGLLPSELKEREDGDLGILISSKFFPMLPFNRTLVLIPKHHVVGIGCRKDIPFDSVNELFCKTLRDMNIAYESVRLIASIDIKRNELALNMLSVKYDIPIVFYTAGELNEQDDIGFTRSDFVKSITDVDCVCERAAVKASKSGELVCRKVAMEGVTISIVREDYTVVFNEGQK